MRVRMSVGSEGMSTSGEVFAVAVMVQIGSHFTPLGFRFWESEPNSLSLGLRKLASQIEELQRDPSGSKSLNALNVIEAERHSNQQ